MERQYGVTARWKPGDKQYEEMKSCLLVENQIRVRATLWSCVVKRHYLLRMKAKYTGRALMFTKKKFFNVFLYADGQKIAKKLCSGISKETRVARHILEEYNAAACELSPSDPAASLQEVLSLKSEFWVQGSPSVPESSIPWKTREEIIQASLTMKRSEEELQILKSDMICTVHYWFHRIETIANKLKALEHSPDTLYIRGAKNMLRKMKTDAELQCQKATSLFSVFVAIPSDVTIEGLVSSIEADESDSESEYDTEEEDSDYDHDTSHSI